MQKLLKKLNELNIKVDLVSGKLDIHAPKGVMTESLLDEIKLQKVALVEFLTLHKAKKDKYKIIPKIPEQTCYELSSAQYRLWLLSQFKGGNVAYNIPSVFELSGNVDFSILRAAFLGLIERHESLRTIFKEDESSIVKQYVLNAKDNQFQLLFEDLSHRECSSAIVKEIIKQEISYVFNLAADSLLRAKLVKLSEGNYVFIFVLHHIISDGWSSDVITNDLFTLYDSLTWKRENNLPELQLQYRDYAVWQRNILQEETVENHKLYWLGKFKGELPVIDLPTFQKRPPVKTYNGSSLTMVYDMMLLKEINSLCISNGCTLFMGVLATINILLYKYTNQNDIIIGSPIAGRDHVDLQNQVGIYINTLALRNQFSKNDSFRALLLAIRNNTLNAYEHQIYPFDELIEQLNIKRDMSRNPLFDIMVTLQNINHVSVNTKKLGNISIKGYDTGEEKVSKVDIEFIFAETSSGLNLTVVYNTDLYSEIFIKRMLCHFEKLLKEIISNPDQKIQCFNYLTTDEQRELLFDFNNTQTSYPKDKTIIDLFEHQAGLNPDHIAVEDGMQSYSYGDLSKRSSQIASFLDAEFGENDISPVGVLMERSVNLLAVLLGVLKSGRSYIPLDPNFPQERLQYILNDSKSKILVSEDKFKLGDTESVKEISAEYILEASALHEGIISRTVTPDSTAYIIYTSGSTGAPKGVEIGHKSLVNFITSMQERPGFSSNDLLFSVTTYSFDISILEFFAPLASGATLHIARQEILSDPKLLIQRIEDTRATIIQGTPSFYQMLFNSDWQGNKGLKVLCGGEMLNESLAEKLINNSFEVWNMYGPTETTIWSSIKKLTNSKDALSIGKSINNTRIYILDESLSLLATGLTGSIYIAGDGLAKGYYNNVLLTNTKFIANPFIPGELMYDTGDLGKWNSHGEIEFLGRNDHQVKIRGFRIELGEIENVLLDYSSVLQQVVVEPKEVNQEKALVAYLVSSVDIDKSDLRVFLQQKLPDYMIPGFYVALDSLPLTPNGKIDRKALPGISGEDVIRKEYVGARTPLEEALVSIWQEVLGLETIGVTDDFFELGGNSLNAIQLVNRIRNQFEISINLNDIFENHAIAKQAGIILDLTSNDDNCFSNVTSPAIVPVVKNSTYALSRNQRRMWIMSQSSEGNLAYSIVLNFKITGKLDTGVLNKAYYQLLSRHEILRTNFIFQQGEPRQVILPINDVKYQVDLIDYLPHRALNINQILTNKANEPMDLTTGPLIKAFVIKITDEEYYFQISNHHIISDGWSSTLLFNELIYLYNAIKNNSSTILTELVLQYKDYSEWQNNLIINGKLEQSKRYWKEKLKGITGNSTIPIDFPRPAVKTFEGNSISFEIADSAVKSLRDSALITNTTPYIITLTVLKILINYYSGGDDLIVGTDFSGRINGDTENMIGMFINIMALRSHPLESKKLHGYIEEVKKVFIDAIEHQEYQFDDIVNDIVTDRDMSRNPLFDINFVMQNYNMNVKMPENLDIHIESVNLVEDLRAAFDITFFVIDTGEHMNLTITYNTNLYKEKTIKILGEQYLYLLKNIIDKIDMSLSDLYQSLDFFTNEFNKNSLNKIKTKNLIGLKAFKNNTIK